MASEGNVHEITDLLAKTNVEQLNVVSLPQKGLKLDTAEDAADIVKAINESKDVQALTLEGNTLGVEAAKAVAEALSKRPEFQRALWSDMFTGRLRSEIPKVLESLGEAIITANAHLTELDLCDNAFGPDGVAAVSKLLTSTPCFSLKVLKFNNNGLGIGGGKILSKALLKCHADSSEGGKPLQLKVFVAGRNRLEDDGATALAEAFKVIGSLEEVTMPQNGINYRGVTALAKSFKANKGLKVVNLNDNIVTAKGAVAMAKVLPALPNLEVINFGDCVLKSKGAIAIGKALKNNHFNLKELILAFDDINKIAAMDIVESMENKEHLSKLDLNGNCFGEDGVEDIRSRLKEMNRVDALESLSDDEGEEDESEEEEDESEEEEDESEEEDEEEEEKEEEEKEIVGDNEEKKEKKNEEEEASLRNAKDFLLCPSSEKFNTIPKPLRIGVVKEALKVHITDLNAMCKSFVQVSSVLKDDKENFLPCTDAILQEAFNISEKPESVANSLLVHMGLLKSEDKIKPNTTDISGPLTALEHAVQKEYFPKNLALYFIAFLSRPNTKTESSSSAEDKLLKTLKNLNL